jgi:2C-methyl-D-erythritol 2,4-cyclodiphosphate synthase
VSRTYLSPKSRDGRELLADLADALDMPVERIEVRSKATQTLGRFRDEAFALA